MKSIEEIHEEPSTPDNDAEYLKLATDKEAIKKRLELATTQLLAEEDREKRRNKDGRKVSQARRRRGSGGRGEKKLKQQMENLSETCKLNQMKRRTIKHSFIGV